MIGGVTSRTEIRTHPDRRIGWACSRHDDIGTLTNTQSDHVCCIWNDGYEIISDNGHVEAINGETLNAFSAAVDEPEPVLLAGLELEFRKAGIRCALLSLVCELSTVEAHFAVDQIAVRERGTWIRRRGHDFLDDLFVRLVVPIAEHDWSNVNVICCLGWTVNDHRSCETGRVLSAIMGVIPRCTENIRKEGIGHACSWGDGALVDSRHAIVPRRSLLEDSMPMKGSALLRARDFVTYIHGDNIAPISFNGWSRECPVDKESRFIHSIGRDVATGDIEIVRGTLTACKDC